MRKRTAWIIGAAVAAAALGGASVAAASVNPFDDDTTGSGSTQQPLNQTDRDKAVDAAMAKVGPGQVTEVERGDDAGSSYEVEIRKSDGSEVEVNIGPNFQVLNQSPDD
ncbi:PepSY domain-containing protein [Arthrobacter sp. AFG20]|uniref:PepSY domain-containing protein n=1 Tax=Arthrobacter sp. AFG20 TaxID=1688671 RepID=UPI0015E0CDC6|nr:PepSY domain-containing protein [Arthrobacter sp. AFG20]